MQSLFLSSKEDVTIFSPVFTPPPSSVHTWDAACERQNAFNKIIHLQPFCSHFSQICVHLQYRPFFSRFFFPPTTAISHPDKSGRVFRGKQELPLVMVAPPGGLDTHCVFLQLWERICSAALSFPGTAAAAATASAHLD